MEALSWPTHQQKYWQAWQAIGSIILTGILFRLPFFPKIQGIGLGVDELQSATHAALPLAELFTSVSTFDPHPPLYYLQLHFWLIGGTGDLWLKLNPVLWTLIAAVSLYLFGRTLVGEHVAWLAAIVMAILPISVFYSFEVRMYSLMMLAAVLVWGFSQRWLSGSGGWLDLVGAGLSGLAFLYAQGAGFLLFTCTLPHTALDILTRRGKATRRSVTYLGLQLVLFFAYLPWLNRANEVRLEHLVAPNFMELLTSIGQLVWGVLYVRHNQAILFSIIGLVLFLLVVVQLFASRELRITVLSYLVSPLLACAIISYLARPIWLTRTIVFTVPFLALCIGGMVAARYAKPLHYLLKGSLLLIAIGMFLGNLYQLVHYDAWTPSKQASLYFQDHATINDTLYITNERLFWAVGWYLQGPCSIHPLTETYHLANPDGWHMIAYPALDTIPVTDVDWVFQRGSDDLSIFKNSSEKVILSEETRFANTTIYRLKMAP